MRIWRNWQTRMVQVHMNANSCRFKSCYPHHIECSWEIWLYEYSIFVFNLIFYGSMSIVVVTRKNRIKCNYKWQKIKLSLVFSSNLLRSNFLEFFKAPFTNYTKYIFLYLVYKLHNYLINKSCRNSRKIAEAVSTLVSDIIKSYISWLVKLW